MIGFTAGGGSTYGGRAEPIIMPVVGDWSPAPAYKEAYYDKAREKASPGYYSVFLDTFKTQAELTATRWASRSEEHTSELQSLMRLSYAVFCLKKKTKKLNKS